MIHAFMIPVTGSVYLNFPFIHCLNYARAGLAWMPHLPRLSPALQVSRAACQPYSASRLVDVAYHHQITSNLYGFKMALHQLLPSWQTQPVPLSLLAVFRTLV